MNKLFLTILAAALIVQNSFSQSRIEGKILESDGSPLEFVNTLLLSASDSSMIKGGISDSTGFFFFDDIPDGNYFIEASMVGYANEKTTVFTHTGNATTNVGEISLDDGIELLEVVVTAKKPFIEMNADKIIVNVSNSAVSAGNNALEVLQKSPGVTVDKDNNISLKGKQGVLVMIDGKNQYMSHEEVARFLESMPASTIESIEIIHNPSARYDAEGNSGIINIKLKRNENLGYNGNLNLAGRQGWNTNMNGSVQLNYRTPNMNVYSNYSSYMWGNDNDFSLYRNIPYADQNTIFDQFSDMHFEGNGHNIRAGADFFLSDKTTLGILWKGNIGQRDQKINNHTVITGGNAPNFNQLMVDTDGDANWDQFSYNANLKKELNDAGSSLTMDIEYSSYGNPSEVNYANQYLDALGSVAQSPSTLRNISDISIDILAAQADYNGRIGNINVEMGSKISSVKTDNATIFEDLVDGQWVNNALRSNQFIYKEDILAGYINGSTNVGKAKIQIGLRVENTRSDGNSISLEEQVIRNYTNLFPSVSLSHQIGEKHHLSYTVSRRLNRPNYRNLNPFIEYLDDYTFSKGNPFLRPQYSNTFGINYGWGNHLFVSASYSKTTEAITEVIEQFSESNTTFQTNANLDDFDAFNMNVTIPIVLHQNWTSRISATGFYNKFISQIPSGTLDNGQASFHLYMANEVSLPHKWRAEVTGWYQSSLSYGLFTIYPQYSMDIGLSRNVMGGKGNLKVGMSDIFHTMRNKVDVEQDDIDLHVRQTRDTRRVTLSFSYRFGNQKVKQARKRKTASEDAAQRIGEGK